MVKEEEYLLTNQEILGGLKSALERGQTLKEAMMSFYQAGYKKEEIEDAARAYLYLQKGISEAQILNENKSKEKNTGKSDEKNTGKPDEKKGIFQKKEKDEKIITQSAQTKVPNTSGVEQKKEVENRPLQKISSYGEEENPKTLKSKTLTITLVVTLFVLLGILAMVILFKSELVNFINGLFG